MAIFLRSFLSPKESLESPDSRKKWRSIVILDANLARNGLIIGLAVALEYDGGGEYFGGGSGGGFVSWLSVDIWLFGELYDNSGSYMTTWGMNRLHNLWRILRLRSMHGIIINLITKYKTTINKGIGASMFQKSLISGFQ